MTDINNLFIQLTKMDGTTGQEKQMADFLAAYFQKLGWKTWFDDSGPKHGSNTGNLYAQLEVDSHFSTLVFAAHMDTVVEAGKIVHPIAENGVIHSDGTTILGSDNRSGICELLLVAQRLAIRKLKHNILFFFTTCEEAGIMGSSFFSYDKPIKAIFNIDSDDAPGVFVTQSFGYQVFTIKVHGVSAHAAKDYENGKHAIALASELILQLPLGGNRVEGWSCNVGTVDGGGRANVIPDLVTLQGEVRGETQEQMQKVLDKLLALCHRHAKKRDIVIEFIFDQESYIPPFMSSNSSLTEICFQAAKTVGLKPIFRKAYSTSDSNFLSTFGAPTISVARGGSKPHSTQESITVHDIEKTVELILALIAKYI